MTRLVTHIRRTALVAVGIASMSAAIVLQFSAASSISIATADTTQLMAMLGLLVLPALTLALLMLNRKLVPARRSARH
jgi:hypothetical protein